MRRTISAAEFEMWIAYHQLSPLTPDRDDFRAGIVASTVANCHRGRHTKAYKPADFMPKYEPTDNASMTEDEMKARILSVSGGAPDGQT